MSSLPAEAAQTPPRSVVAGLDGASRAWVESGVIAFVARLAFFAIGMAAGWFLLSVTSGPPERGFQEMWRGWDAHHFLTIAEHGYTAPQSDAHAAAFFPAFPLAVRPLLWMGLTPVVAGLLVSAVAAVVAGYFLHRLAEDELGEGAGRRALVYLTIFPTGVFLVAPYSESLFLAGAIAAFYLARRERWHLVGLPAAVAMGARAAGLFLLLGLAVEFLRQRNFSKERLANAGLALVLGVLPLLAYGAFLGQAMGNPFEFLDHQREGWGRTFVGPVDSFRSTWSTWESASTTQTNFLLAWRIEIVAAVAGIAATVWGAWKREWGYVAFMGSMMAVLLTSTWYYSIPRMLLTMFPITLFLAEASGRRPALHEWLVVSLAPLAALGVVVFTQHNWFF